MNKFDIISDMKHIHLSRMQRAIVVAFLTLIIAGLALVQLILPQFAESPGDIIRRTDKSDYNDLSKEDINARSKAKFGTSINGLSAKDVEKHTEKEDYGSALYEAAQLLSAAGNTKKSLEMYEVASAEQKGVVDQDFYRDYRNTLDDVGQHAEATELMRKQLTLLRQQKPVDEVAIARVESQISEREEYYK